jgi:hypothetical protein
MTAGSAPIAERLPQPARRRQILRRFIVAAGAPVSLLDQVSAINLAHEKASAALRAFVRGRRYARGSAEHGEALAHIDALRAARATLARLVEAEAAHIGGPLEASTRAAVNGALDHAPNALELAR